MPSKTNPSTIISIVGPTATGKTALALEKAQELLIQSPKISGIDLISADSRQIYRQFEIISGADLGEFRALGFNWQRHPDLYPYPFLANDYDEKIRFHGAAILDFPDEWSLALFQKFATQIIDFAEQNNRRVILVGGTMLYHDHLFDQNDQTIVPPNNELRQKANSLSVEKLQDWLRELDQDKLTSLNNSDIRNPRRLTRHIEIALWLKEHPDQALTQNPLEAQHQYLIPDFDQESLKQKIAGRVKIRFQTGAVQEVERTLKRFPELAVIGSAAQTAGLPLGFYEIAAYLHNELDQQETLNLWSLHEWQYAKRQITWWKSKGLL